MKRTGGAITPVSSTSFKRFVFSPNKSKLWSAATGRRSGFRSGFDLAAMESDDKSKLWSAATGRRSGFRSGFDLAAMESDDKSSHSKNKAMESDDKSKLWSAATGRRSGFRSGFDLAAMESDDKSSHSIRAVACNRARAIATNRARWLGHAYRCENRGRIRACNHSRQTPAP